LPGSGEAGDVIDLGDEHGGEHPADTVGGLDGLVTGMATQRPVDPHLRARDRDSERVCPSCARALGPSDMVLQMGWAARGGTPDWAVQIVTFLS
jgi:hypothetical protein